MKLYDRLVVFSKLSVFFSENLYIDYQFSINNGALRNLWFTDDNIRNAIQYWSDHLKMDVLLAWLTPYRLKEPKQSKRVLLVLAGNIPLVGFHDFLTSIIIGHKVLIKMSSNDNILLPIIINKLFDIEPEFRNYIYIVDDNLRSKEFDTTIATGSDNSSRYFEYYFRNKVKIIRKSRRSVAILSGNESDKELSLLAYDIFLYFGLGCRNVSKLFLPTGYDLNKLFNAFGNYKHVIQHVKYKNNYDYYKSFFLLSKYKYYDNGFLIMKEESSIFSPVSVLHYEFYDNTCSVEHFISEHSSQIQCIVSHSNIPFGKSQTPDLWDYADGIDTIKFLRGV